MLVVLSRCSPDQNFFFLRSENLSICDEDGEGDGVDEDEADEDDDSQRRIAGSGCEMVLLLELRLLLLKISLASRPRWSWLSECLNPVVELVDWFLANCFVGVVVRESPIL